MRNRHFLSSFVVCVSLAACSDAPSAPERALSPPGPRYTLGANVGIHRLYSNTYNEHMYGTDPNEGAGANGYGLEYLNYFYLLPGAATGHAALYRCFDMWTLDHFVSTDPYCATRTNEGLLGYIATSQLSGTVPLYQTHDPQNDNRFYTISASERQTVLNWGWYDEGIAGYVYLQP